MAITTISLSSFDRFSTPWLGGSTHILEPRSNQLVHTAYVPPNSQNWTLVLLCFASPSAWHSHAPHLHTGHGCPILGNGLVGALQRFAGMGAVHIVGLEVGSRSHGSLVALQ